MKHIVFLYYCFVLAAGFSVAILEGAIACNTPNSRIRALFRLNVAFLLFFAHQLAEFYVAAIVGYSSDGSSLAFLATKTAIYALLNPVMVGFFGKVLFESPSGKMIEALRVAASIALPAAFLCFLIFSPEGSFLADEGARAVDRLEAVILILLSALFWSRLSRLYKTGATETEKKVIVLAKPIVLLTVISLSLYLIFRDSFSKWNISVGFLPYFLFTAASAALIRKFVFDARVPKSDGMKIVLHSPQEKGGLRSFFDSLSLTRKERSIAYLILKGMTNEEIANEEMMSVLTVKKHVSSIYRKSSVRSRVELMQAIRSMLS